MNPGDVLLAIETTCDETAAAVIARDLTVRSSIVASQDELHQRFGGVVPEIASRAHLRRVIPVIDEALERAKVSRDDLTAIAVAVRPGLVGSLLVGLTAAKTLAAVLDVPLLGVDHIAAHIYACRMFAEREVFPAIGFVVSGGHTNLYDCPSATDTRLIGSTIDDAAGEAFDKVAKVIGLPYPGGPAIQSAAETGDPQAFSLPRSLLDDPLNLDFSFSGLKTAVTYLFRGTPGGQQRAEPMGPEQIPDLAASFQEAVVDVLIEKCRRAMARFGRERLLVGGGVAANQRFREQLVELAKTESIEVIIAPPSMCTDNAAMAGIAWEMLAAGQTAELDVDVTPGLVRRER